MDLQSALQEAATDRISTDLESQLATLARAPEPWGAITPPLE